jgi:hypothetical protein
MDLSRQASIAVVALLAAASLTFAAPDDAQAFCGFYVSGAEADLYNDATMVSLMRDGKRTVLSMQNSYEGPPEDFALVVPVPVVLEKKQVKTLPGDVFKRLDRLTAPRLVEYWERDPCQPRQRGMLMSGRTRRSAAPRVKLDSAGSAKPKVKVHAKFTVGEYDIVVLSSTESTALETWLNENKYNIPKGAAPYFKPYIQNGQYFFVAKVDVEKVTFKDGEAVLSPLRFHYDTDDFVLPVRLGLINSKGVQDLITFILAKGQRYEVANYPNVTVPTNIVVNDEVKKNFGGFYNELFDNVLDENPNAVVTEYSWATSTCDPCPGPPLRNNDLMTLGADVLPFSEPSTAKTQSGRSPGALSRRVPGRAFGGWVVTRLHARYNKHTLGKDLVFKKASAILGGRGTPEDAEGTLSEKGSRKSSVNNFQGRYIMLHHWAGEVECESPSRGIWGGPGGRGKASARAADDLAFDKPTSKLALAKYVEAEEVTGLKNATAKYNKLVGNVLATSGGPAAEEEAEPEAAEETGGESADEESADEESVDEDSKAQPVKKDAAKKSSGGCASSSGAAEAGGSFLVLLLLIGGVGRFWRRG